MTQTVLIAEDEPTIRTLVAISLQQEYCVLSACDADEALSVARSHENIALLLTDVQMCGGSMNGIELAEQILEEKPETKVLVMSGLPDSLALAAKKGYPSLAKPFRSTTLTERVREVLVAKIPAHDAETAERGRIDVNAIPAQERRRRRVPLRNTELAS
jgi:DNA-binding NtrC family response regulator